MGSIFGFLTGVGLVISAWTGELQPWGFGGFAVLAALGILLIPRTIGTFLTGVMLLSPVAAISGAISGNGQSALTALGIGVGSFATQFLVGAIRRESAY